ILLTHGLYRHVDDRLTTLCNRCVCSWLGV
ncbi:MATE efflux family protein, partial [Vibrio parahaemolyticus VPTS-2010_2]